MTGSAVTELMLAGCLLYICIGLFFKPFKKLAGICLKGFLGICSIFITNFFLSPWNIAVGINAVTAFISIALGLPGIMAMYGIMWFLT